MDGLGSRWLIGCTVGSHGYTSSLQDRLQSVWYSLACGMANMDKLIVQF